MKSAQSFFREEIIEAIGWTIVHSLWQAILIFIALSILLFFLKKYSAQVRYIISFTALLVIMIWSGITAASSYGYARDKTQLKNTLLNNPEEITELLKLEFSKEGSLKTDVSSTKLSLIKLKAQLQRNFHIVFSIWLLGIFFFLLKLVGGLTYIHKLRRKKTSALNMVWKAKIDELKTRLNIDKTIQTMQSQLARVPMTLGYFKPVILLPVSLCTGLNPKEIEAIIAHELAHIKRNDYILNIIQTVIETLFFYHPIVWLISKKIRNEREISCDELAIEITGDKINYIKALATAKEQDLRTSNNLILAFSSKKEGLLNRVIRIKNYTSMKKNITESFIAASLIFASLILLSFTFDNQNLKAELNTFPTSENVQEQTVSRKSSKKLNRDSTKIVIVKTVETLEDLPEEVEQLVEIVYTDDDSELSNLIIESIDLAVKEVEISKVVEEALIEAENALKEIDINMIIREAMEEAKLDMECAAEEHEIARSAANLAHTKMEKARVEMECEAEAHEIAKSALNLAQVTMEAIDIDGIVNMAIEGVQEVFEAVNMEEIMEEAFLESKKAIECMDIEDIMEHAIEVEVMNELEEEINEELEEEQFKTKKKQARTLNKKAEQKDIKKMSSEEEKIKKMTQQLKDLEE